MTVMRATSRGELVLKLRADETAVRLAERRKADILITVVCLD